MKRYLTLSLLLLTTGLGCGGPPHKKPTGPCTTGRACPTVCTSSSACTRGQVCAQGVCANPAPTSTTYDRCYLDSDCNPGDYCSVGVCTHDCAQDSDCSSGTVCTARGRCVVPAKVSAPPPPPDTPAGASLAVTQAGQPVERVDFGDKQSSQIVTVSNAGVGTLKVWLLSDQSFFHASPSFLALGAGEAKQVTLTLDAGAPAADTTLEALSSAGDVTIPILHRATIDGRFQGIMVFDQPVDLGSRSFVVELSQVSGATTVTGEVDASVSPSFRLNAPVASGTVSTASSGDTQVGFEVKSVGIPNSEINPSFGLPILHDYTLTGKVTGTGIIAGTVIDHIKGVYATHDIVLTGTFRLVRTGPTTGLTAATPPTFQPGTPTTPTWGTCTACPPGQVCGSPRQTADAYVKAAFPFYFDYLNQDGSAQQPLFGFASSNGTTYQSVENYCSSHPCFLSSYAMCALKLSEANAYTDDLLDVVKGVAAYFALKGSDKVTQTVVTGLRANTTLASEVPSYTGAATFAGYALHLRTSTYVNDFPGPLDPWTLARLWNDIPVGQRSSVLPEVPTGTGCTPGTTVEPGGDLARLVSALETELFAERTMLDARERVDAVAANASQLPALRSDARKAIAGGELDEAILADLYHHLGLSTQGVFTKVRDELRGIQGIYRNLADSRNPAGLPPDTTVIERTSNADLSDFQVIYDQAMAVTDGTGPMLNKGYTQAVSSALGSLNEIEHTQAAMTTTLQNLEAGLGNQLTAICGKGVAYDQTTGKLTTCGVSGGATSTPQGEYPVARDEAEKALVRLQVARNEVTNLKARMAIEEKRFKQIQGVDISKIAMVEQSGQRLKYENLKQAQMQRTQAAFDAGSSVLNAVATALSSKSALSGVLQGIAGLVQASSAWVAADNQNTIDNARTDIQTDKEVSFIRAGMKTDAINHAAAIENLLLQEGNLELEVVLASKDLSEKLLQFANLLAQAQTLVRELMAQTQTTSCMALHDPVLHTTLTSEMELAERRAEEARFWVYLARRALEYDANASVPSATPGEIFTATSPSTLDTYLGDLDAYWSGNAVWTPAQEQYDIVSLKSLFGITGPVADSVTGEKISANEQFRRYALAAENWQPDGSLKISFSTLPGKAGADIFSNSTYNDHVQKVAVNFVGDNLGDKQAKIAVEQSGLNALETSNASGYNYYHLETAGYRAPQSWQSSDSLTSFFDLGINDDLVSAVNSSKLLPSLEFAGRAVRAGSWSIIFDPSSLNNRDIDLSSLDDIQILFVHGGLSVQH